MAQAPAKAPKLPSALSCVRLGKLPTPKSVLAVPANVVHLAQLVSQARMVTTDNQARMERREAQAGMPTRKITCCQFHLNANAWPSQVQLVQLVQREPMVHPEMQVALVPMVNPAQPDHLVQLAHLVPTETLVQMVLLVLLVL